MDHQKIKEYISSLSDGELDGELKREVEEHLAGCPECKREFEEMSKLEEVMRNVRLKSPPVEVWQTYWLSVYNRLERRIGWILLSLGAMILLFFGGYKAVEGIIRDVTISPLLKAGILISLAGTVVLLVSLIREQFFVRKRERYKEIEK